MTSVDMGRIWQEAERLSGLGEDAKAGALYICLLEDRSIAPYAHLRLSIAAQRTGDVRGSVQHALEAFGKSYADPVLLEMTCKLLLRLGETHAALACVNALLGMPTPPAFLAEVGKMLSDHMQPDAALACLQRAMAGGMSNLPAMQYLLGLNLMYAGELEQAEQALEASLLGNEELAPAHWALAKLGRVAGREMRIRRLKKLLTGESGKGGADSLLWYSLFHELDRSDQISEAWQALEKAMLIRRGQIRYDEATYEALFAEAIRALQYAGTAPSVISGNRGAAPVFVVGLPRSGTTVIEQALCAQADVASGGELRDLAIQMRWVTKRAGSYQIDSELLRSLDHEHLQVLGERYLAHTQWRARGHAFYTDKWPENYFAIGHILAAMPEARIICVRRGAADACFSNLKEWFAAAYPYSYSQQEVARQYMRYERFLDKVRELRSPRVAFVEYETFVRQPQRVVGGLKVLLDLPSRLTPLSFESVPTASAVQVRDGVSARHIGSWSRYEASLSPMLDELACGGFGKKAGGVG